MNIHYLAVLFIRDFIHFEPVIGLSLLDFIINAVNQDGGHWVKKIEYLTLPRSSVSNWLGIFFK